MSRSLRSRPLTLYQSQRGSVAPQEPLIPPVPEDGRGRGNTSYDSGPSGGKPGKSGGVSSMKKTMGKRTGLSKASEVGSNLKKRLSMRYAEPTHVDSGGFSAIPEVPSLPTVIPGAPDLPPDAYGYGQTGAGYDANGRQLPIMGEGFGQVDTHQDAMATLDEAMEGSSHHSHSQIASLQGRTSLDGRVSAAPLSLEGFTRDPAIDLDLLSQENFDAEMYLKMKLSHSSEDFLRQFQDSLKAAKEAASSDLKRQVFRNYSEFITVSKEIATLENDMLELKELLSEWKTLPQALELEEGGMDGLGSLTDSALRGRSLRGNRNSMVDLQQIYKAQIMSLWEGIEGSQKFLPLVPGRHLIAEASSFTELNAATYKPKQSVALFLLDDLLLIAVRKKRQMSARVRLVAERCFSLAEIVVIDLKDGGELTNAIKIKRGKESFVYRTDRGEDKRALLNAFRRVAEELANKRRKDSLAEAEARKRDSIFPGADSGVLSGSGRLTGSVDTLRRGGVSSSDDSSGRGGNEKDLNRWLSDFSDQIAVAIALREWGEAVDLVEKGQALLAEHDINTSSESANATHRELSLRIRSLVSQLVEAISHDLSSPLLKKTSVVRNVGFLLRLDKGERAREIFLNSRSELLKRRSRQIKFEGDVSLYISELALVHFTLIKNTSEWYMSAFKDNHMASGFVRWAASQIESYAEIFRRQVYGMADQDPKVVTEAVEITMSSASQLKEVGLDLTFFLKDLLKVDGQNASAMGAAAAAVGGASAPGVPSLTVTLADDPDAIAKRLSAIDIRRQSYIARQ
ncbi:hypothetical protein L7F22_043707 [Adiantum nelumboides]|nr:hypothetical protein [Adiantum nelumboides]